MNSRKLYIYGLYIVAASMALPLDHLFYVPLLFGWILSFRHTLSVVKKSIEAKACLLLFVLYLIGLFYSEDFSHGLAALEKRYFWIINLWLLTGVPSLEKEEIKRVYIAFAWGIVGSLLLAYTIAIFNSISAGYIGQFNDQYGVYENFFLYHKLSGNIKIHAIVLSVYVLFALHIFLRGIIRDQLKNKWKILYWLALILCAGSIVLLQSAIVLGAFGLSLLIVAGNYLYKYPPKRKRVISYIVIGGLIFTISLSALIVNKLDFKENKISYCIEDPPSEFNGLNLRLALWWVSGKVVRDNFWFGVGTGDIDIVLAEYYDKYRFHFARRDVFHSHNQFLHTHSMIGILGLLTLVFIFLRGFYWSFRKRDLLFFLFNLIFLLHSITDASLTSNKGIMFYTFFYFLFIYSETLAPKTKQNS